MGHSDAISAQIRAEVHAYKKVPPKRFSYVEAVKKHGDYWRAPAPFAYGTSERYTFDFWEYIRMSDMERGHEPRVEIE
jgi:hypothetical protein